MKQAKYKDDYCGSQKLADMDWREFITDDDKLDDIDESKPASPDIIAALGVNPDELFKDE